MKRMMSILLVSIIAIICIMPAYASETHIDIVTQNETTGQITISLKTNKNEDIKVYKEIDSEISLITSFNVDKEETEIDVNFPELSCSHNQVVTIYAIDSAGKSNTINVNAHGPHNVGDWVITKVATCNENGIESRKCTDCEKVIDTKSISATGHQWGDPVWKWSDDYKSATATFICKKDSEHTNSVTDTNVKSEKTAPSTCAAEGSVTYSATIVFNGETYTNAKIVSTGKISHKISDWITTKKPTCTETGTKVKKCTVCGAILETSTVPSLNHDYKITYTWDKNNKTCTALATCTRDKNHVIKETVVGVDKIIKKATCQKAGDITRTATFSNPLFKPQIKSTNFAGAHTDVNKDKICDVCRMSLSDTLINSISNTSSEQNLFDKLFSGKDEDKTTAPSVTTTTTQSTTITSTTTSLHDATTINSTSQDDEESNKMPKSKIVIVSAACITLTVMCAVVSILTIKRTKKVLKEEENET